MEILIYDKYKEMTLSPKLSLSEYRCRCLGVTCVKTLVLASTVKSFNLTRAAFGFPIEVTSAFRCINHNAFVGGVLNSFHTVGAAMDLRPVGDFTEEKLDKLELLAGLYYDVVIRYEGFTHCHNTSDDFRTQEQ